MLRNLRLLNVKHVRYYGDKIMSHYNNPLNVGSLDKRKSNVASGLVGSPACGDVIKLDIEVDNNKIVDCKFKVFGCGSAIAASSYGTELVKGKTLDDAIKVTNLDIASHLSLPPIKLHCSMLMEDAIKAAIDNYKKK